MQSWLSQVETDGKAVGGVVQRGGADAGMHTVRQGQKAVQAVSEGFEAVGVI